MLKLGGVQFGVLAQMVEQRTENPCVPSSILGGATNKNKGLRQIVNPFLVSEIDYNVTTKGCFWGVFEWIDYNPYYKKKRPNRGGFGLYWLKYFWYEFYLIRTIFLTSL